MLEYNLDQTTYNRLMAEAKAEYDAWVIVARDLRIRKLLDMVTARRVQN